MKERGDGGKERECRFRVRIKERADKEMKRQREIEKECVDHGREKDERESKRKIERP